MTHDPALRHAYHHCQEITRRASSNFYYAFLLLPPERREALFALYAFCRFLDDVADDAGCRRPAELLRHWRDELDRVFEGCPRHQIGLALADAAGRFPLERRHFLDLIDGVESDLSHTRYESFDDLHRYCYRVASTVGLLCIEIFGYQNPSAREYAVDLGVAFQLTNILRDIREDAERGRIYLPAEDLRRFGVSEDDLRAGKGAEPVLRLLRFEADRARDFYDKSRPLLDLIHPRSRPSLEALIAIYSRVLDRIVERNYDVFSSRVRLSALEKSWILVRAIAGRRENLEVRS
jgi:phytoene synthase